MLTWDTKQDPDRHMYNNDGERDAGTIQGNRASTHSRFSDTVLQVPSKTSNHSVAGKKTTAAQEIKNIAEVEGHISDVQTPVLFNKYALDRENTGRLNRLSRSSDQRNELEKNMQQHLTLDIPIPPPLHPSPQTISRDLIGNIDKQRNERLSPGYLGSASFSHLEEGSSPSTLGRPRIMSPMGFAISRQHSHRQRPTRLSRLREDVDYDDFDDYGIMSYDYEESSIGHSRTKPVPIWLCVFLVVTYILCGAALFMRWEGWSFLDSAYFCFITLTTIGFGDFVPARRVKKNDAEVSIALCSLYLLFGIALLAMSFNLVQEEVINNVKSVAKRLGIVKDDEEDDGE
uniref:Potassium channel domain-containing protein n=1 Tax=Timema poppense TaxID=170557 RepID=A0A7R9GZP9_TIMPO|nr:unnamed protein product [Timema poppensis]